MKYEIKIDEALVPEGKVPSRLTSRWLKGGLRGSREKELILEFKAVHVPKIPDFVPEGWWIYRNNISDRVFVTNEKTVNGNSSWYLSATNAICIEVTGLHFDIDALFGDLPPEQCCFQQKGN